MEGFFKMCWPTLVLNLKTLFFVACVFAYGVELEAALLRFSCLNFPMVVLTLRNVGHSSIEVDIIFSYLIADLDNVT
jgi:hypothetical protein